MDDAALLEVLVEAAAAVRRALDGLEDWGPSGRRPGQYHLDLAADEAALGVLHEAGLAVMSEESGRSGGDGDLLVALDPVDGSTNAHRGIPVFSTSLCVLDADGPRVALVVNQATGVRHDAVRGHGARRNGAPIAPSGCAELAGAVVGVSGLPARHPGWAQFRALGAASLELCAVADGVLDAYLVCGGATLYGWDYLAGMLICTEAGAPVADLEGAPLVVRDDAVRHPVAAATPRLLEALVRAEI